METHLRRTRAAAQRLHQPTGLRFGFPRGFRAKFHHQPPTAFGQECESLGVDALGPRIADEKIVKAFEPDRFVRHDFGNMVGTLVDIGIGDDQQHTFRRTLDQTARCFENRNAGAFGADERPRNVEAILRQKIIQVVAGDPTRDIRKTLAHEIAVVGADGLQFGVNLGAAAALLPNLFKLRCWTLRQPSYAHRRM